MQELPREKLTLKKIYSLIELVTYLEDSKLSLESAYKCSDDILPVEVQQKLRKAIEIVDDAIKQIAARYSVLRGEVR